MSIISIGRRVRIEENEVQIRFYRSSGPGGQNVNKVETAVLLQFDIASSPSLPPDIKNRLMSLAGHRLSSEGVLSIRAQRFRTQEGNKRDAFERFIELVKKASERPTPRRPTVPTRASKERRMETKRKRGNVKRSRGLAPGLED